MCVVYCSVCMVCVLCMFGMFFYGTGVVSFWYICGMCYYVTYACEVYTHNLGCMCGVHYIVSNIDVGMLAFV